MTDTIFIRTTDNFIYEIERDKWCKQCRYIHALYSRLNTVKEIKVDFDSIVFDKLNKMIKNSIIYYDWKDYEKLALKYCIDITPSLYIWLQNNQFYNDYDYIHNCRIINVLCNDEYVVFRDINGHIYKWDNEKYLSGILCPYNSKFSADVALNLELSLLAITNNDRNLLIIINLKTGRVFTKSLPFIVAKFIISHTLIWQNDILFVKNLEGVLHSFSISLTGINNENISFLQPITPLFDDKTRIVKYDDTLRVQYKNNHFIVTNVGEKCIFDYSETILVYANLTCLTIFNLRDDI